MAARSKKTRNNSKKNDRERVLYIRLTEAAEHKLNQLVAKRAAAGETHTKKAAVVWLIENAKV